MFPHPLTKFYHIVNTTLTFRAYFTILRRCTAGFSGISKGSRRPHPFTNVIFKEYEA
mgnify:CR=1 FL=1